MFKLSSILLQQNWYQYKSKINGKKKDNLKIRKKESSEILVQHTTGKKIWIQVYVILYIHTPKRLIVSTQSIYCHVLAMHFCISLEGHIKIDLKNRLIEVLD